MNNILRKFSKYYSAFPNLLPCSKLVTKTVPMMFWLKYNRTKCKLGVFSEYYWPLVHFTFPLKYLNNVAQLMSTWVKMKTVEIINRFIVWFLTIQIKKQHGWKNMSITVWNIQHRAKLSKISPFLWSFIKICL